MNFYSNAHLKWYNVVTINFNDKWICFWQTSAATEQKQKQIQMFHIVLNYYVISKLSFPYFHSFWINEIHYNTHINIFGEVIAFQTCIKKKPCIHSRTCFTAICCCCWCRCYPSSIRTFFSFSFYNHKANKNVQFSGQHFNLLTLNNFVHIFSSSFILSFVHFIFISHAGFST